MLGIGGNTQAVIQVRTVSKNAIGEVQKNAIGEQDVTWQDVKTLKGWLDLASGNSGYQTYNAKIQESTHYFICDYVPLNDSITAENARMLIKGKAYDILLLDNPMEMNQQLEFYLKYTGGQ